MTLMVYGIPTCDTCKKALQWLVAQGVDHEFVNTKESPPSATQIQDWVTALGNKALRNTSGKSYRALGEEKQDWSDRQWVEAFAADAMLIKRPLFVRKGRAVAVGFKVSDIAEIIQGS